METFINELTAGLPDAPQFFRVLIRLLIACLLGGIIGLQREQSGKAAGLRTHMLVSAGAALFVVSGEESGMTSEDLSRVVQGLATGIGFIGAGGIIKLPEDRYIGGLTTAAGIWMTAAVGAAAGLGCWGAAGISVVLTWVILAGLLRFERRSSDPGEQAT